jgi:CRP/FNR family transcriptional regulator
MSLWLKTGDSSLLERVVKKKQVFKRGEVLYRMGQSLEYIYVIRGGSVKTCVSTEDGQVQVMGFHIAGELLGLNAIGNRQHNCEARATGVTSVCEVSVDRFEELARKDPAIQYEIFKIMSAEIRHSQELLLLLGKHNADERLAAFLLNLSQQFAQRHCSATEFNLSMSRSDIGDHLGIAEETVCRVFARFHDEGLISCECKHIRLNDLKRLRQIANHRTTSGSQNVVVTRLQA